MMRISKNIFIVGLIVLMFSCDEENSSQQNDNDKKESNELAFLTYSENSSNKGLNLIELNTITGEKNSIFITDKVPYYIENNSFNLNGDRLSFISTNLEVVYGEVKSNMNVVPELPIPDGFDFSSVMEANSEYLNDGRVVFLGTHGYDYGHANFSSLYIYSPTKNEFHSFGELREYAKSDPAAGEDTEVGDIVGKGFTVSNNQ